jgi:hypothetical protein
MQLLWQAFVGVLPFSLTHSVIGRVKKSRVSSSRRARAPVKKNKNKGQLQQQKKFIEDNV